MPRLLVEKGPDRGKSITIAVGGQIVAGRDKTADLQLSDSMASRRHFLIASKGSIFGLKDLNSANGTLVNGRAAQGAHKLAFGDSIQIGETLISWMPDEQTDKRGGLIGQQIGGYRVEERLGRGAMGTVYKATQLSLGRTVALKVLSPDLVKDQKFCEMFIKEARAAGSLNHPNIIQVYDVGEEGDQYYFSMEFASKGSVLEELAQVKAIPLPRAVQIIKHACQALDYAERKGLVHRDIKPDNLMVTEDNSVKLGDLGLAMSTQELQSEQDGVFGTPHYIAPEQAMGKPIDHRADIYALGATFYRMLTGKTLYTGATVKEILKKQVREPHPPITDHVPDCPQAIVRIIDRMLAKTPAERYQHAADIVTDLTNWEMLAARQAAADGSAFADRPGRLSPEASQQLEALGRQRKLMIAGIVALVAVLAAGTSIAIFAFGGDDPVRNNDIAANTNSGTGGGNSQPQEVPAEVREANENIKSSMNVVDFILTGTPGIGELNTAISKLENALNESPKAEVAVREAARKRLDELVAKRDTMLEGAKDVADEWQETRRESAGLVKQFKYAEATRKLQGFIDKYKDSPSEDVKKIVEDATLYLGVTHKTEVNQHLNGFEATQKQAMETARRDPPAKRAEIAREVIDAVRAAEEACDETVSKERLKAYADLVERELAGFKRDAEAAERQALEQAAARARLSLNAVLDLCRQDVAKGDFANVKTRIEAWQAADADYAAHKGKLAFKQIEDDLRGRINMTEIQRQSLARLEKDLPGMSVINELIKNNPWPQNVNKLFDGATMLRLKVQDSLTSRQWNLTTFTPRGTDTTYEAANFITREDRAAVAAALVHIIQHHGGLWAKLMLPVYSGGPPVLYGLFYWMADLEAHDSAFLLIQHAWRNIGTNDPARPLVREAYARGLLNRALALAARGDQTTANTLLRELEADFADTRANRDRS